MGFGNGANNTSSTVVDRQLYLGTNGRAYFGVGSSKIVVTSTSLVNDGAWHHIVGTYTTGAAGERLYVDGTLQGSATATPTSLTGYWRAGSESMSGWTSNPGTHLVGNLEDLAIYPSTLTSTQVKAHYDAGVTP